MCERATLTLGSQFDSSNAKYCDLPFSKPVRIEAGERKGFLVHVNSIGGLVLRGGFGPEVCVRAGLRASLCMFVCLCTSLYLCQCLSVIVLAPTREYLCVRASLTFISGTHRRLGHGRWNGSIVSRRAVISSHIPLSNTVNKPLSYLHKRLEDVMKRTK